MPRLRLSDVHHETTSEILAARRSISQQVKRGGILKENQRERKAGPRLDGPPKLRYCEIPLP